MGVLPTPAPIATAVYIGLSFENTPQQRPMVNGGSALSAGAIIDNHSYYRGNDAERK